MDGSLRHLPFMNRSWPWLLMTNRLRPTTSMALLLMLLSGCEMRTPEGPTGRLHKLPARLPATELVGASRLTKAAEGYRAAPSRPAQRTLARAAFPELVPTVSDSALLPMTVSWPKRVNEPIQLRTSAGLFKVRRLKAGLAPWAWDGARDTVFGDDFHLVSPAGAFQALPEGGGWRTGRIEEYWIADRTEPVWTVDYEVDVPPGIVEVRDTGDWLEFLDTRGVPRLRFHPLTARDAGGTQRRGELALGGVRPAESGQFRISLARVHLRNEIALEGLTAPVVLDPGWSSTSVMASARAAQSTTLLTNGRVLVAGGVDSAGAVLNSSEVLDPESSAWSAGPALANQRAHHTATRLLDGRILVVGGQNGAIFPPEAEVYDPRANTWSSGGIATGRREHTATLLPDGRVLVIGGSAISGARLTSVELYSAVLNTWTSAPALPEVRSLHTANLLQDGRVLVSGGNGLTAQTPRVDLFDPSNGVWTPASPLANGRAEHAATVLLSGQVLVSGGETGGTQLSSCERFNPLSGVWSSAGTMTATRSEHTATLLPDGRVLVAGGRSTIGMNQGGELYNPAMDAWTSAGLFSQQRRRHGSVLLPTGRVLSVGGFTVPSNTTVTATAEVYEPGTDVWGGGAGDVFVGRDLHTVNLLLDGRVWMAGGRSVGVPVSVTELFSPSTSAWAAGPVLNQARWGHSTTLLLDGRVLVAGGRGVGAMNLASAERFDPVAGVVSTLSASMTQARREHAAVRLNDGRVLVVGGFASGAPVESTELFDPQASTWMARASMATPRQGHRAT
ncbi:MAG: Kelch repeat-containing protein, partial [Myxococcaceae bacterium]